MSKVGKIPVKLPSGVSFKLENGKAEFSSAGSVVHIDVPVGVFVKKVENAIHVSIEGDTKQLKALWGTVRSLINNAVAGLVTPFQKRLEFIGVGYKVAVVGSSVEMQLAYSHPVKVKIPDDVSVKAEKQTTLLVQSKSKDALGAFLKLLQQYRKPEPYKGKGIIIEGQYVYRKEGKKK